ncbi:kinase-like protein [Suillus brevipes Sb2]|nr:kinase-like protein [Suillus brevipes Sb2]
MNKVPIRIDGRFRLGDVLGSGSYTVVYRAQNIIKDDVVAVKLEPIIDGSSSVQQEYHILKQLEGGVGIHRALWFSRESTYHALVLDLLGPSLHDLFLTHNRKFPLHTLSRLEYIHSHNYVHGDIKPQNITVGLHDLRHTDFIINFGISQEYCDISARLHFPFCHNQCLTGTPAFTSINNHIGVEPGRRGNLESLTYMLIYFLLLCREIPVEFATMLIYTRSLAFSEDPDYDHLRSLLHAKGCLQAYAHVMAPCHMQILLHHVRKETGG